MRCENNQDSQGILTFAFGNQTYIDQAIALGRSLTLNCANIARAVVTDSSSPLLHALFDVVVPLDASRGMGVAQKLYIDLYTPFEKTLFIDCDSVVLRDLQFAFDMFTQSGACVIGTENWFATDNLNVANLAKVLQTLQINSIPCFNGGVYFIDRNSKHKSMMEKARELLNRYKEYGFLEFRGNGPADEMLIGAAMALTGCQSVGDEGRLMRTPIGLSGKLSVDTIRGEAAFVKYGVCVHPAIVHFAVPFQNDHVYIRERLKLETYFESRFLAPHFALLAGWRLELKQMLSILWAKTFQLLPRPIRLFVHGYRNRMSVK